MNDHSMGSTEQRVELPAPAIAWARALALAYGRVADSYTGTGDELRQLEAVLEEHIGAGEG